MAARIKTRRARTPRLPRRARQVFCSSGRVRHAWNLRAGNWCTNSKAPPLSAKGGAPRAVIYLRDRERCAFLATLPRAANIKPADLTLRQSLRARGRRYEGIL